MTCRVAMNGGLHDKDAHDVIFILLLLFVRHSPFLRFPRICFGAKVGSISDGPLVVC